MKLIIISLNLLFFCACSFNANSGTIQKAEKSYLKFIGNSDGVSILIDDDNSFKLAGTIENKDMVYQLTHGKHKLKVFRNNKLISNRIIFLEDNGTMEIMIQ
jgi:hypothetical protein